MEKIGERKSGTGRLAFLLTVSSVWQPYPTDYKLPTNLLQTFLFSKFLKEKQNLKYNLLFLLLSLTIISKWMPLCKCIGIIINNLRTNNCEKFDFHVTIQCNQLMETTFLSEFLGFLEISRIWFHIFFKIAP